MNRLLALVGFLALGAFLAILAINVPHPDLIAVIILTIVLVGYDFVTSSGPKE